MPPFAELVPELVSPDLARCCGVSVVRADASQAVVGRAVPGVGERLTPIRGTEQGAARSGPGPRGSGR